MTNKKIFCIGNVKTGTCSLKKLGIALGYKSVHNYSWCKANPEKLKKYDFFTDGGGHIWDKKQTDNINYWGSNTSHLINKLYKQYPDAKFILNTRALEDWLISKMYWGGWKKEIVLNTDESYDKIKYNDKKWRHRSYAALKDWILYRENYYNKVLNFFKKNNNLHNLLIVDYIGDENSVDKICHFLGKNKISFEGHFNKTKKKNLSTTNHFKKILKKVFKDLNISDPRTIL